MRSTDRTSRFSTTTGLDWKQQASALLCSSHPRCGARSPARLLPPAALRDLVTQWLLGRPGPAGVAVAWYRQRTQHTCGLAGSCFLGVSRSTLGVARGPAACPEALSWVDSRTCVVQSGGNDEANLWGGDMEMQLMSLPGGEKTPVHKLMGWCGVPFGVASNEDWLVQCSDTELFIWKVAETEGGGGKRVLAPASVCHVDTDGDSFDLDVIRFFARNELGISAWKDKVITFMLVDVEQSYNTKVLVVLNKVTLRAMKGAGYRVIWLNQTPLVEIAGLGLINSVDNPGTAEQTLKPLGHTLSHLWEVDASHYAFISPDNPDICQVWNLADPPIRYCSIPVTPGASLTTAAGFLIVSVATEIRIIDPHTGTLILTIIPSEPPMLPEKRV
ncbi:hypothetical protein Pelo_1484 [Pelomyxa schiedti]|nr:hypothetical protein Pelo_1484 [Pelomyxa schiedti]